MVGPALRKKDSHKAIHDANLGVAEERVDTMKHLLNKQEHETLVEDMYEFIEYVEGRIITHTDSEEEDEGLYTETVKNNPDLHDKIQHLIRDHDLMRIIIDLMKKELENDEIDFQKLVDYSSAITLVNEIHSRDEEETLWDP